MTKLTADEIPWRLPPIEHLEDVNWLALTEEETWAYIRSLRADRAAMRWLFGAVLDQHVRLTRTIQYQSETIRTQNDIIKRLTEPRP